MLRVNSTETTLQTLERVYYFSNKYNKNKVTRNLFIYKETFILKRIVTFPIILLNGKSIYFHNDLLHSSLVSYRL